MVDRIATYCQIPFSCYADPMYLMNRFMAIDSMTRSARSRRKGSAILDDVLASALN